MPPSRDGAAGYRIVSNIVLRPCIWAFSIAAFLACAGTVFAEDISEPPQEMKALQEVEKGLDGIAEGKLRPREEGLRDAARSYGARGGLARRSWEIWEDIKNRGPQLAQVFDFRPLLIAGPAGLLIEPPVVIESLDALEIVEGGKKAAVASRKLVKIQDEAIVSAPRTWRMYLEMVWSDVKPPPSLLLPKNDEERALWRQWVAEGWKEGVAQANEIFQINLERLTRDYVGMVRFRQLAAQGQMSFPYADEEDRGVTGGGKEMVIGNRAVRITAPSALNARSELWQPVQR